MDNWDQEAIDLVEPGVIEFDENGLGELAFIAVTGELDCRDADRDGRTGVEFSWQGSDEGDDVSGRGWAALNPDGTLEGHIYFHLGDDSAFRAERFNGILREHPLSSRRRKLSDQAEKVVAEETPKARCGTAARDPHLSFPSTQDPVGQLDVTGLYETRPRDLGGSLSLDETERVTARSRGPGVTFARSAGWLSAGL
jgi:hypothetical protein